MLTGLKWKKKKNFENQLGKREICQLKEESSINHEEKNKVQNSLIAIKRNSLSSRWKIEKQIVFSIFQIIFPSNLYFALYIISS